MSLVTVKSFGIALGISGGTIRSKKSRGQIRCNSKGLIDTEHPTNYIYLLEVNGGDQSVFELYDVSPKNKTNVNKKSDIVTSLLQKKDNLVKKDLGKVESNPKPMKSVFKEVSNDKGSVKVVHTPKTKVIPEKKVIKITPEEKKEVSERNKYNATLLNFDIRKKEAEVVLKEREAELKQYELEKKAGNTLPLDQVITMMSINYKAIFKSFHSQLKNIASTVVQNLGGSKDDLNVIMIELEQHLNHIVKLSKDKSDVEIEKIIEEYSEVRSRGERKA